MNEIMMVLIVLAIGTWLAAAVGAALVVFVKKESGKLTNLILGFAAGVILIVVFVELLHPAIHSAEIYSSLPAWIVVPGAFAFGFLCTFLLDKYVSRMKSKKSENGDIRYKQGWMLIGALSAHSIPEGLALGILLGSLGSHFYFEDILIFLPIVVAIGLHKVPEGTAISVAFQKDGMPKPKSFMLGQISGLFGFLMGVLGFVLAVSVDMLLPYAMAFAGGAMIWVAIHELIPESNKNRKKSPYTTVIGVFLGILLMLFIDITLHDHNHAHSHSHSHQHYSHDHDEHHHDEHDDDHNH